MASRRFPTRVIWPRLRRLAVPILTLALCLSVLSHGKAFAAEPIPGADEASIRTWLYANNPELKALQAEADAADARIKPAGALPDPMAEVSLLEIDPDHPSLLPNQVGSTKYIIRQRFPLWGKRGLARDIARNQAQALSLGRDANALKILAQADQAYVRYWHARVSVAVIDRLIALLEEIEKVTDLRYVLGIAPQQDSIRAQVARTAMQRDRIERMASRSEAAAALNAALGRRADAPLAEPTQQPILPMADDPSLDAALHRLERGTHPALQASAAMVTAAHDNVELQRRNRYPDITLGVGAMQRGNRLDSYELMLQVDIPLQQGARRERERESRLLEDAAQQRTDATRVELEGSLGMAWANWTSARERHRLIEKTLLPQSEANYKSAMASYQVGQVDFGTMLDALREWQGADLARVDSIRDELLAAATVRATEGDLP
jgi:cobalt-zinc-cadmium efflux system outer membrane protein